MYRNAYKELRFDEEKEEHKNERKKKGYEIHPFDMRIKWIHIEINIWSIFGLG